MASTSVVFDILARDRASSKFAQVANAADRSSSRMSKMGTALKGAAAVGFGALAYGAASFAKSSIDIEKQFSTTMRLTQAATKASAGEMDKLNDLAIKLGADTSFSANEAATAMLELAKAGLDTKTIMGGGLAGTLTLAAAGGTDLATASTIASNAMNTFNLAGRDMDKIAAALAGGANASSASVESLGQALQQVGPGATNAGLSLQETVAALSAFDAAGIKGSDAGTSLKTMLTRLVPATDKAQQAMEDYNLSFVNADGSFKSLTQISEQLRQGLSKLSDEQRTHALATIFGSDATRAATVLMHEGAKGIQQYIKATNDQAAAEKMAAARMGGTEGAMERLSGSIETAKLRLGQELAPMVVKVADGLGENLVPAMEHVIDGGKEMADAVAPAFREIAEALGHLAGEGGAAGDFFEDTFIPALRATAEVVGNAVDLIDDLPGPVKEFGAQAAVAAFALSKMSAAMEAVKGSQFIATMATAEGRTAKFAAAAKTAAGVGGLLALTHGMSEADRKTGAFMETLGGAAAGFSVGGPIGSVIGAFAGAIDGLRRHFSGAEDASAELRHEQERTEAAAEQKAAFDDLRASLNQLTGAYTGATRAAVFKQLQDQGLIDTARQFGLSGRTLVDATLGQQQALEQVTTTLRDASTVYKVVEEDGKKVRRSFIDVDSEAHQLSNDLGLLRVNTRNAGIAQREAADATESLRRRLGLTRGELAKVPRDVRINIRDDVPDSLREIERLGAQVGHLDRSTIRILLKAADLPVTKKNVDAVTSAIRDANREARKKLVARFEAANLPATLKGIARFAAARKNVDGKAIRALVRVLGVDATVAQVRRAEKALDKTDKKTARPVVKVDGVTGLMSELRRADKTVEATGNKTAKPKLKADGVPGFLSDFLHANRTMDETGKKTSRPKILGEGFTGFFSDFARANAVMSATDARPPVHTYIYTHHVDIHETRNGKADGGTIGYSSGGTVAGQRAPYGDKVSTMLAPGEEVTSNRRGQADRFRPALKAINADKPPAEVAKIIERLADGGTTGGGGMSRLRFDPQINARMTVNASKFKGVGAGVIHAFAQGINGTAHEAEKAVDRMLAAISKALKKKDITEAAAKQMREAVQAMAREAERGRAMLSKRADFAKSLRESFAGELGLGELVSSESFGGIGDITGGAQALAARLKAFAGQLRELREDGIPKGLIAEIAGLGSDQGSKAAAAILAGTQGQEAALSSAYNAFQQAAGLAANTAANVRYGTAGQIKNEFHVEIHVDAGGHGGQGGHGNHDAHRIGREAARGFHQELLKIKRETGQPLGLS